MDEPDAEYVVVAGGRIRSLVWRGGAGSGAPPLVLVHGTSANAHWWEHIAPALAGERTVVAVELSGHGDSDHRAAYDVETWSDEVLAVIATVDDAGRGVHLVGHSLGGSIGALTATRAPGSIVGLCLCETIRDPMATHHPSPRFSDRPYYGTFDEALARFRPYPPQPHADPVVVRRIGRQSITSYPEGWSWKHDHEMARDLRERVPTLDDLLPEVECAMALLRAELGYVSAEDGEALRAATGARLQVIELRGSGHHPMLDQPEILTRVLSDVLRGWSAVA